MGSSARTPLSSRDLAHTPAPTPLTKSEWEATKSGTKKVLQAIETKSLDTCGSDMLGKEAKLPLMERIFLALDRECTPVLYVYFAGLAIMTVIILGVIILVGIRCNWDFYAPQKDCDLFAIL